MKPSLIAFKKLDREGKFTKLVSHKNGTKTRGRKRKSMAKMAEFSQSISGSELEITPKKKKKRISRISEEKFEEKPDNFPSIDELLRLPEGTEDGGKSLNEVLDEVDKNIAERQRKHEDIMSKIDIDIAAEKKRQDERVERMKQNAVFRDRLQAELTEPLLRKIIGENMDYVKRINAGAVNSLRHQAYHKSIRSRHAIYYTMITDPYTDDQLDWTLDELGMVFMKTKKEQMDMNEYIWKVLLPELFIKIYSDFFSVDKIEAEKRIGETPLEAEDEDDDKEL